MKRIFITAISYLFIVDGIAAQVDKGIHFEKGLNWEQVKEKAKEAHKYIFVDCYASWCGPCKLMDKDIYSNELLGNYINKHFISVKRQLDTAAQDDDQIIKIYSEAHQMMLEYKINAFPTLLFFSPDGNIVHRGLGFKKQEEFMALSNDAMDSNKQYYSVLERFNRGNLDTANMKSLAREINAMGDKELAAKIANQYINCQNDKDIYAPDNIWFMIEFTTTTKDRGFSIFKDHAEKIHKSINQIDPGNLKVILENIIYKEDMKPYLTSKNGVPDWAKMKSNVKKYDSLGEETYRFYKPDIIFRSLIAPELKKDPNWNKIISVIKKQHAGKGQEFLVGSTVVYYLNRGLVSGTSNDCRNFMVSATYYFKNYYSYLSADPLNTWAWTVFQRSLDKRDLTIALIWSDSCLKLSLKPDAGYLDTYANLLYKLGRVEEAIIWEGKAVSIAPDDKVIQGNFIKMKNGDVTW